VAGFPGGFVRFFCYMTPLVFLSSRLKPPLGGRRVAPPPINIVFRKGVLYGLSPPMRASYFGKVASPCIKISFPGVFFSPLLFLSGGKFHVIFLVLIPFGTQISLFFLHPSLRGRAGSTPPPPPPPPPPSPPPPRPTRITPGDWVVLFQRSSPPPIQKGFQSY